MEYQKKILYCCTKIRALNLPTINYENNETYSCGTHMHATKFIYQFPSEWMVVNFRGHALQKQ